MDKQTIQELISANSECVTFALYDGKEMAWKNFVLVSIDDNKVPYVKCARCNTAFISLHLFKQSYSDIILQ